MTVFEQALILKDLLAKTNPTLDDVEKATIKAIEECASIFLHRRWCNQDKVIPSIVLASQTFAGVPRDKYDYSYFVKSTMVKNLEGAVKTFSVFWKFPEDLVRERVVKGCLGFIAKVKTENNMN